MNLSLQPQLSVIDHIDEGVLLAFQVTTKILSKDGENLADIKGAGPPNVGGDDDIFHFPERVALGKGLLVENVQTRARNGS